MHEYYMNINIYDAHARNCRRNKARATTTFSCDMSIHLVVCNKIHVIAPFYSFIVEYIILTVFCSLILAARIRKFEKKKKMENRLPPRIISSLNFSAAKKGGEEEEEVN